MQLHQQFNLTPFRTRIGFCQDSDGRNLALALLKTTFHYERDGRLAVAPKAASVPIFDRDVFYDAPATSSLRYASDMVPAKRGVDVAVVGHVYGHKAKVIEAGFRVGGSEKVLAACGPRCWVAGRLGGIAGPLPFSEIPLRYEQAYGGSYLDKAGQTRIFDLNPVGVGFSDAVRDKAPLPSVEYRTAPIKTIADRPLPAGLGFIPTGWKQRATFAGTFNADWEHSRRPLFPKDFDERFYNAVPQDQVLAAGLLGGERVVLRNLDRRAESVVFGLPQLCFVTSFRIKDRHEEFPMKADTLLFEPDEGRFSICFRATCILGFDFRFLKSVTYREGGR